MEGEITAHLERAELRDAFRKIFTLSSRGNKIFQDAEPWKRRETEPEAIKTLLHDLVHLVRDLAILSLPYIPATACKILSSLGCEEASWKDLGKPGGISRIKAPEILFRRLEDKEIEGFRQQFSGSQKERKEALEEKEKTAREKAKVDTRNWLKNTVELRAAKIVKGEKHPDAEKLYVEEIDCGKETRQILSGLVPHYKPEELLGKTIILVANLKPAKLRGLLSKGMLLAADDGEGRVEVLEVPDVEPGTRIYLQGDPGEDSPLSEITVDDFFSVKIEVRENKVQIEGMQLVCDGKGVFTKQIREGTVG